MKKSIIILNLLLISMTGYGQNLEVEGDMTVSGLISGVEDPIADQDAATKNYVDQLSERMLDAGLGGIVIDIDGNVYKTIKYGNQVWMAKNLRTSRFNDGTAIPEVTSNTDWSNLTTPAFCWQENDSTANAEQFGALYNYYTVSDTNSQNVCPVGWDVPTLAEWDELDDFLTDSGFGFGGSGNDIGKSMAVAYRWNNSGTTGNVGNDLGTNNASGFSGLPSGQRSEFGTFQSFGSSGTWWTTEFDGSIVSTKFVGTNFNTLFQGGLIENHGVSVRCIRD